MRLSYDPILAEQLGQPSLQFLDSLQLDPLQLDPLRLDPLRLDTL